MNDLVPSNTIISIQMNNLLGKLSIKIVKKNTKALPIALPNTITLVYKKNSLTLVLGAAAPGFNSLIPAPSVPSLISTEPVELLCRASNISSTDPFCFV